MGLIERLFGKRGSGAAGAAVPGEDVLSLQVVFPAKLRFDQASLTKAVRGYDTPMATAEVELEIDPGSGSRLGAIAWSEHAVQLVGFDAPMPASAVEPCVQPSHYDAKLKTRVRAHKAHVLLYYAGTAASPVDRYVALAAVAGALSADALVVLNANGHTSLPAAALETQGPGMLDLLKTMPIPMLFSGFVKLEVEDVPGVWMRTYGDHLLDLPDLAYHAHSHDEGEETFELFSNVLAYLASSRARFAAGHTLNAGTSVLRLRAPRPDETFLDSKGTLFVLEKLPGSSSVH